MNILVGVDLLVGDPQRTGGLTAGSQVAVDYALRLAKTRPARVHFMHVFQQAASSNCQQDALLKIVDRARRRGVDAESSLAAGATWHELDRRMRQSGHDLLVIGTQAAKKRARGSAKLSAKLLQSGDRSMLVAAKDATSPRVIMLVYDLQANSTLAMEQACALAQQCGATLHVVCGINYPQLNATFPSRVLAIEGRARRAQARARIEHELRQFHCSQVKVHLEPCTDAPTVLALARRWNVDLLVATSMPAAGRIFRNNLIQHLAFRAPCSLLVVGSPHCSGLSENSESSQA